MSISKNLSALLAGSLLVTLASCGQHHRSNSQTRSINPVCSELDCLSSVSWKILLQGKNFPEKSRVDINGTTVLNECVSKQKYSINRHTQPESLYLENFYVPKRGELKIDVVDLNDCDTDTDDTTIVNDTNVEFEVTKDVETSEILIRL